jgi:uncharacterized protein (TIGR03790 family)
MQQPLRRGPRLLCAAVAVLALCAGPSALHAQSADNVAVVINESSADSQRIGEHYARSRGIPDGNVIRIKVAPQETIDRSVFASSIEAPIAGAIRRAGLHDRLLYIVLTKGVPLRIAGTTGLSGTLSSVDSELTLLYRRMAGQAVLPAGKIDNPYFLGAREIREAQPFSHREHDIYLVTRIDAFTTDQALALIDRAQHPSGDGRIVLDQIDDDAGKAGNRWIAQAAQRLMEEGHTARIALEATEQRADADGMTLGWYAFGAADPAQRRRSTGMTFTPGAIAANLASANARTFTAPPDDWMPAGSNEPATFYAGSSEVLMGDLIRDGITGVSGQVDEPYVLGAVHPEILFPAYLAGFNLAEAFYLATPTLSWTTIVVGDPLCRPFAGRTLTTTDLESAIDPRTELPMLFSRRRVAAAAATGYADLPEKALLSALRAEALLARGDRAGTRAALEQAIAAAPSAIGLLLTLAQLEEADGAYDGAIAHYRRIIEVQPANVVALNNLAYLHAVRRNSPAEALPLAKRAASLAPRSASVLDTWAWTEHLLGNDAVAAKILAEAIAIDPTIAETRLHAAVIAAVAGDRAKAESELKEAIRLDTALEQRDDTRELRERINAIPPRKQH